MKSKFCFWCEKKILDFAVVWNREWFCCVDCQQAFEKRLKEVIGYERPVKNSVQALPKL